MKTYILLSGNSFKSQLNQYLSGGERFGFNNKSTSTQLPACVGVGGVGNHATNILINIPYSFPLTDFFSCGRGIPHSFEKWLPAHQLKLGECERWWLYFEGMWSGKSKITRNHCKHRDCPVAGCIKARFNHYKKLFNDFYKLGDNIRFVTLTTGGHRVLNRFVLDNAWRDLNNYFRRFNRLCDKRKIPRYKAVSILEAKKEPGGLYHIHFHLSYLGFSPHHSTATNVWSDVVGKHCSTETKYRASKKVVLNYLVKRLVYAGLEYDIGAEKWQGIPSRDYFYIAGRRLFRVFGMTRSDIKEAVSNLEVYGNKSATVEPEDRETWFYVGKVWRNIGEDRPPPDLQARIYSDFSICT